MAPTATVSTTKTMEVASPAPSLLDSKQTLRATTALLRKINADIATEASSKEKSNLLADADDEDVDDEVPVWLVLTTKKHILDKKRLKPGKILLPNPYLDTTTTANLRICLITADPQRIYKDLIAHPTFPLDVSKHIQRVIGLSKLKAKYKSYEARRQLLSEYDVFLADDRIVTQLPLVLGKVFYARTSKRPVPVTLEGKRQSVDAQGQKRRTLAQGGSKAPRADPRPADCAHEISRTLRCALVHLAPATTTAVKIGVASQPPAALQANVDAVVAALVDRFVPRKWANVRAVHLKGPNTAALPIWLTDELWADERDVLDEPPPVKEKKRKRGALTAAGEEVIEVPGADGKMRRLVKPSVGQENAEAEVEAIAVPEKKRKSVSKDELAVKAADKLEKAARKEDLKKQKAEAKAAANGVTKPTSADVVDSPARSTRSSRKPRMKAEDLF